MNDTTPLSWAEMGPLMEQNGYGVALTGRSLWTAFVWQANSAGTGVRIQAYDPLDALNQLHQHMLTHDLPVFNQPPRQKTSIDQITEEEWVLLLRVFELIRNDLLRKGNKS